MRKMIYFVMLLILLSFAFAVTPSCPIQTPCIINKTFFSVILAYDKQIINIDPYYLNEYTLPLGTYKKVPISMSRINGSAFRFTTNVVYAKVYFLNTTAISEDNQKNTELNYFAVLIPNLEIKLVNPPFGVATSNLINVTIKTNRPADCRHNYHNDVWENYYQFDKTNIIDGVQYFTIYNYRITEGFDSKLFVTCYDPATSDDYMNAWSIYLDTTPPKITYITAEPSIVSERNPKGKFESNIVVDTDDPTVCRIGPESLSYANLPIAFDLESEQVYDSYSTTHSTPISVSNEGTYTYYVACKSLTGDTTQIERASFVVNTSAVLSIVKITPEENSLVAGSKSTLAITTNKPSKCLYGSGFDFANTATGSFATKGYFHESVNLSLTGGKNNYVFKCDYVGSRGTETANAKVFFIVDATPPIKPTVSASASEGNGSTTYVSTRLRAIISSSDPESGIVQYAYKVIMQNGTPISDTDVHSGSEQNISILIGGLEMKSGQRYSVIVSAQNGAGMWSQNSSSNAILYDNNTLPGYCTNGVLDATLETDVDCGNKCLPCIKTNSSCKNSADCATTTCTGLGCQPTSCTDKIKNGDELDVDCGGLCKSCSRNSSCFVNSDCTTPFKCVAAKCIQDDCSNGITDVSESDTDCGKSCPACASGKRCWSNSDCKSGLECKDSRCSEKIIKENPDDIIVPPPENQFNWLWLIPIPIVVIIILVIMIALSKPKPQPQQRQTFQNASYPGSFTPNRPLGAPGMPITRKPIAPIRPVMLRKKEKEKTDRSSMFSEFEGEAHESKTDELKPIAVKSEEKSETKIPAVEVKSEKSAEKSAEKPTETKTEKVASKPKKRAKKTPTSDILLSLKDQANKK